MFSLEVCGLLALVALDLMYRPYHSVCISVFIIKQARLWLTRWFRNYVKVKWHVLCYRLIGINTENEDKLVKFYQQRNMTLF